MDVPSIIAAETFEMVLLRFAEADLVNEICFPRACALVAIPIVSPIYGSPIACFPEIDGALHRGFHRLRFLEERCTSVREGEGDPSFSFQGSIHLHHGHHQRETPTLLQDEIERFETVCRL